MRVLLFLLQECLRLGFLWTESMRRGRDPSRRPRRPVFDNPRGQLPGTGIRSDAENLYSGNLYGGSAQGVSGNSSGGVAVTGESSSGGRSLPVNVLGNGSGGASTSGQASACAGEERPSLFSDSGNRLPLFNPFAAAMATLGPAERYESQYMGANEFLNRRLNEEFQRAFDACKLHEVFSCYVWGCVFGSKPSLGTCVVSHQQIC